MVVTLNTRTVLVFAAGVAAALLGAVTFQAWRVDAAPGDADATFVPITPCRLLDTRPAPFRVGTAGRLGIDDTRTIASHGSQGDCAIPTDAVGLTMNVTAVDASAPTFVTVWPGGTRPQASSLNPTPAQPPTPNAVTNSLSATGTFDAYNLAGSIDLIFDVNGYFTKASLTDLESRVAALEASRPFASTAYESGEEYSANTEESLVSLMVTAPADGQVTVDSATWVETNDPGGQLVCSISSGDAFDEQYAQIWVSAGAVGDRAQLSGTRTFDLTAGDAGEYHLFCRNEGDQIAQFVAGTLTAIFTAAPG